MNPEEKSALQQKYPLSPRKFWKKIIEKLIVWYVLGILGIIFDFILIFSTNDSYNKESSSILWFTFVAMLIFLFLVTFLYSWYIKIYIKRYYYSGEEHFITIKKGVFAPTEIHVQWQKIQDVYVDQDILDRIMGLYDVHIASATATSGIEAHIDGVDQVAAEGLKKFLLDKVSGVSRGNFQNNTNTQSPDQTQIAQPQNPVINLKEEISNNRYPLSDKWLTITLISRILSAFIYSAFLMFIFTSRAKDFSYADNLNYLILIWLAVGVAITIARIITLFLWKKNYAFNFTPEHIYFREGVISMSEKHMPYSSIQDVSVKQSVIERLFGLSKVVIENAAQQQTIQTRYGRQPIGFAGIMLQGLSLADANKITDILKTTVLGKNNSQYGL